MATLTVLLAALGFGSAATADWEEHRGAIPVPLVKVVLQDDGWVFIQASAFPRTEGPERVYVARISPFEIVVRYDPDLDGTSVSIDGLPGIMFWDELQRSVDGQPPNRPFVSGRRAVIWVTDYLELQVWEEYLASARGAHDALKRKNKRKVRPTPIPALTDVSDDPPSVTVDARPWANVSWRPVGIVCPGCIPMEWCETLTVDATKPLRIYDLKPGRYEFRFESDKFETFTRVVSIPETHKIIVDLERDGRLKAKIR